MILGVCVDSQDTIVCGVAMGNVHSGSKPVKQIQTEGPSIKQLTCPGIDDQSLGILPVQEDKTTQSDAGNAGDTGEAGCRSAFPFKGRVNSWRSLS